MSNEQQGQGKEGKKIRKKFEENVDFFKGILESREKGELLKTNRIPNDKLGDVLEKITEKRYKTAVEKFMTGFDEILEKMMTYNKFIAQKKKEIEKLEEAEMKKMNEEFQKLYNQFEDINTLRQEAGKALRGILGDTPAGEENDDDDDEEKND